jgi:hypothetical protein
MPKKKPLDEPVWINCQVGCPHIRGVLEISNLPKCIWIIGDPDGLRSLAAVCLWLADQDQEIHPNMPDGERQHVHLDAWRPKYKTGELSPFSEDVEVCRLDAKGTGQFTEKYQRFKQQSRPPKPSSQRRSTSRGRTPKKKPATSKPRARKDR